MTWPSCTRLADVAVLYLVPGTGRRSHLVVPPAATPDSGGGCSMAGGVMSFPPYADGWLTMLVVGVIHVVLHVFLHLVLVVGGILYFSTLCFQRKGHYVSPKAPPMTTPMLLPVLRQVVVSDNRPPVPPLERCPPRLADLLRRCWARAPLERPSAQQVVVELSNMMHEMDSGGGYSTA